MSDTPETDEAQFGTGRVSVDFARRLERERDAYKAQLDRLAKMSYEWERYYSNPDLASVCCELALELRQALAAVKGDTP